MRIYIKSSVEPHHTAKHRTMLGRRKVRLVAAVYIFISITYPSLSSGNVVFNRLSPLKEQSQSIESFLAEDSALGSEMKSYLRNYQHHLRSSEETLSKVARNTETIQSMMRKLRRMVAMKAAREKYLQRMKNIL